MQLAQLNIARPRAALDDAVMRDFMDGLEPINRLADAADGFVWRLQDESGNATAVTGPFGEGVIVNLSLWRDIESLRLFTYKSEHALYVRRRRAWFEELEGPHLVLWWVVAEHRPSLVEAKARLERLAAAGPSPFAFTFTRAFDAQGRPVRREPRAARSSDSIGPAAAGV